ncbi:MAG: DUF2971 domain-containing protein [Lachnospiraceae bacterium]|nr:DUF2971 domain-containing protein [Lachnospiraceae bacterium]
MLLYHYTDFNALNGIVGNAELRLNNILNMNDTSEMRLFVNGLRDNVLVDLKNAGLDRQFTLAKDFFKKEFAAEFHYSAYAACFSEYRDDAAQWERYAKGGQGVCIAFHKELLEKIVEDSGSVSLKKVYYRDSVEGHELIKKFTKAMSDLKSFDGQRKKIHTLMNDAWISSAAFKHPSFTSENEVRLIYTPFSAEEAAVKPKYHIAWDRIKKYYPLDLNDLCEKVGVKLVDLVDEIIIGPASPQSLPILQDYLTDSGLKTLASRVSLSSCPLRKPTT